MHLTQHAHDVVSGGQASADEIEITPEMISAGVLALDAGRGVYHDEMLVRRFISPSGSQLWLTEDLVGHIVGNPTGR
jgi:hypothetical protein